MVSCSFRISGSNKVKRICVGKTSPINRYHIAVFYFINMQNKKKIFQKTLILKQKIVSYLSLNIYFWHLEPSLLFQYLNIHGQEFSCWVSCRSESQKGCWNHLFWCNPGQMGFLLSIAKTQHHWNPPGLYCWHHFCCWGRDSIKFIV